MSNYDDRQYRMMLKLLKGLDAGNYDLGKIIADLEVLLASLRHPDQAWKAAFYKQWAILEDTYADSLYKGLNQLPPDYQKLVDDAIQAMRRLVQERIDSGAGGDAKPSGS